jgi:hypothetical protein
MYKLNNLAMKVLEYYESIGIAMVFKGYSEPEKGKTIRSKTYVATGRWFSPFPLQIKLTATIELKYC